MTANRKYSAIVIGTSAGGLAALTTVLGNLPADKCVPIIVVQHRAKEQRDLLEEVLQRKCKLQVKQADEKERLEKGVVYIAPPDYHLLVENDLTLSLSSDELVMYSRPSIDVLFESAAMVYKERLTGILLTGASSDGTKGMQLIKQYGGLTIAQLPAEAQWPAMPKAAVDSGAAMQVLTLQEIHETILNNYCS